MKTKFDLSRPPPRPETVEEARALVRDLQAELARVEAKRAALEIRKRLLEADGAAPGTDSHLTPKARRRLEKRFKRLLREQDRDDVE